MKMGYLKLVQREDERQAAMAGLMTKQLTQPGVEKHLDPSIHEPSGGSDRGVVADFCGTVLKKKHNPGKPRPQEAY